MIGLLDLLRRFIRPDEAGLGRKWQRRTSTAEARKACRSLRIVPGPGRVVLGRPHEPSAGDGWLGVSTRKLVGEHGLIAGGTGSGKTVAVVTLISQLLRDGVSLVLFDAKGETVDLLLTVLLPALAAADPDANLAGRVRVIRPFDPEFSPPLNLLAPEPGVTPAEQAFSVVSAIEEGLADPFGIRMHHIAVRLVALGIELGVTLPRVLQWVRYPAAFARDAQRSSDPSLREYGRVGWAQETRASLEAVAARLDALLLVPSVREAVAAEGGPDFASVLREPGSITAISTGDPPVGSERVARFWSSALFGSLCRAILSRAVDARTPPVVVVGEEIQECLGGAQATLLGRFLATARHKRAAIWVTGQSRSQLAAVDPGLVQALRANIGYQLQFRSSPEDAEAFAHALPVATTARRPAEVRRELVRDVTMLRRREAYLWMRSAGLHAVRIRTPRVDLVGLREQASCCDPATRLAIRRGLWAMPRAELRQRALAAIAETAGPAPPIFSILPTTTAPDGGLPFLG